MSQERIGYIWVSHSFGSVNPHPGEVVVGAAFTPVQQVAPGEYKPWSEKQVTELEKFGFRRVLAVSAEVVYEEGTTKIHHSGHRADCLKGVSDEEEAELRLNLTPVMIEHMIDTFYADLPSNRKEPNEPTV
jgi:hypothetical protein